MSLAVILLIAPSTAFAAPKTTEAAITAYPTPVFYDFGEYRYFLYEPSLELAAKSTIILQDTASSDNWFHVPADQEFRFDICVSSTNSYYRIVITRSGTGTVHDSGVIPAELSHDVYLPAMSTDAKYQIWLITTTPLTLYSYGGLCYTN